MPNEIEVKMRPSDLEAVRCELERLGAEPRGMVLETNTYYDDAAENLRGGDRGLRIRVARPIDPQTHRPLPGRDAETIVTWKGPRQRSAMKVREEIEFTADDAEAVDALFARLELRPVMRFQKRRQSWRLERCRVEFDELPEIGRYVEVEGPDEASVETVRARLGLADTPIEHRPYLALLRDRRPDGPRGEGLVFGFPA